jgi:hypothetical protein
MLIAAWIRHGLEQAVLVLAVELAVLADRAAPDVFFDIWVPCRPIIVPLYLLECSCSPWVPGSGWVMLGPYNLRTEGVVLVLRHMHLEQVLALVFGFFTTLTSLIFSRSGAGILCSPVFLALMIWCTSLSPGYASSIFRARTSESSSSSSGSSSCVGSAASADVGCGSAGGPAASEDGGTGGAGKGGVGCGNVKLERRASTSNGLDQDGN